MHHINNSAKLVGWSVVRPAASWRQRTTQRQDHNQIPRYWSTCYYQSAARGSITFVDGESQQKNARDSVQGMRRQRNNRSERNACCSAAEPVRHCSIFTEQMSCLFVRCVWIPCESARWATDIRSKNYCLHSVLELGQRLNGSRNLNVSSLCSRSPN